ncbi:unnamed protein product [Trichogramma brassicae]|uniref:Reverse transcriptase domain-containing protein n=1 Tax=Trichogramma brassicae TaxID=86971 RepID=A0A6H5HW76_9HYME|nr:unnamed protein product [Trichogramma brassicae]
MQTSGGVHGGPRRPFGSPARISERKIDRRRHRVRHHCGPGGRSEGARGAAASTAPSSPSTFVTRSTRRGGNNILAALERIRTPEYLQKIIYSYFQARVLEYDTDDGPESCSISAGVPQGSVLGPIL